MADQKSRGGQKQSRQQPGEQPKRGETTQGAGKRPDADKRQDQMASPDDARRQPTNEQR